MISGFDFFELLEAQVSSAFAGIKVVNEERKGIFHDCLSVIEEMADRISAESLDINIDRNTLDINISVCDCNHYSSNEDDYYIVPAHIKQVRFSDYKGEKRGKIITYVFGGYWEDAPKIIK